MLQRNDIGKRYRRYFIEIEKNNKPTELELAENYLSAVKAKLALEVENKN